MTAIADFLLRVKPEIPGGVDTVIIRYIRDAAIEFCDRSWYWRQDLTPINTAAGTSTYTIAPPVDSVISEIISVKHNDIPLKPVIEADLDASNPKWRTEQAEQATRWTATARDSVTLYAAPSVTATGAIKVKAVLKPSQTAATLPNSLYDNYLNAIAAKAKSLLMAMPGETWSNPEHSAYYQSIFDKGVSDAKVSALKGYNRTTMDMAPPRFR